MKEENQTQEMSKYELKKLLKELEDIRGRNTELVSLYIPAGYDMSKISEFITSEQSEAENIKSKHTRTNVQDALGKIGRKVKEEQQTPENGVAFFAGNISDTEGRPEIEVWEVVPPQPIESRHYRCDKEFVIEPLQQMIVDDRVYGLIVADKNEAAIGYLQGSSIKTVNTLESNVPGKTKAGGQCLDPDSIVHMSNGELKRIEDIEVGDSVKSAEFESMELKDSKVVDKWREEKTVYEIETKFPRKSITCSGDHEVFTSKLEKKAVENLEEGEKLLFPEKTETGSRERILNTEKYFNSFKVSEKGREKLKEIRKEHGYSQGSLGQQVDATQTAISKIELGERDVRTGFLRDICEVLELDFKEFAQDYCRGKDYKLPKGIGRDLAEILGYFAGDGSFDPERLNFHEQDREVAEYYQEKLEKVFNCDTKIRFREDKNYHLLRAFGKPLVKFIKGEFPEIKKSRNTRIPAKILEADKDVVQGFIQGLYDAEGHCSESRGRMGISANNKIMMQQLQSTLLRNEVISSLTTYDNKGNPHTDNTRYTVSISDEESIQNFAENVGFCSDRKNEELEKICQLTKSKNNNRQIIKDGEEVRKVLENNGRQFSEFKNSNMYLQGKREISKTKFEENIKKESEGKLEKELNEIHSSQILPTKIQSIEKKEEKEVVDISVEAGNFIANNLIVHNSAQRFSRLRKEMLKTFLGEIAEKSKNAFMKKSREDKLLGIIVGGPGFVKDKLLDDDYLHQELQDKVITRKSLDVSGEAGLSQLVEKAEEEIEDSQVVKEKNLVNEFFENLQKENGKSEYGVEQVEEALKMGAVETVLISEDVNLYRAKYECPQGHEKEVFEQKPEISDSIGCDECNEEMSLEDIGDIVDVFGEKAEEMSTDLEIISTDHEEGQRLMNLGGVAAIMRYRIR
jgi:peptide subunit release factor 1 (eRF1)/transcriptional regulator with XRE-family HTH domain